ncbi:MAG: peptide chain release factor N(5)-glutamine methyltransferase [Deltaproteobacteria bacterium]|nr:peptide chain release factor N(5)-glutamine methyltransferase [Deltaproteobacteria bacterium]
MTWTLLSLLNWTTEFFTKKEIPTARLDAEVLLAHLLKIERIQLYVQFERVMSEEELAAFKKLILRRAEGEPVSYIRGVKEFWSLPFKVGPGVLVPRPDTEVLLETVLGKIPPHPPFSKGGVMEEALYFPPLKKGGRGDLQLTVLDIGTGTGNIAIALAKTFPNAQITAIDLSEEALAYARDNAKTHQADIQFLRMDFLKEIPEGKFDLVVSNPPYIASAVIETLGPAVKNYEPRAALDGGPTGLDFYRRIGETAIVFLKEDGLLAVEMGEDQEGSVKGIFERAGLKKIEVRKDYAGLPRVVTAHG